MGLLFLLAFPSKAGEVLLVATPGVPFALHQPLIEALQRSGATVDVLELPCVGDLASILSLIRQRADGTDVLVAHGLAATLSLAASPQVSRYVLLGPVLSVPTTRAWRERGEALYGGAAGAMLLGTPLAEGCSAPALRAALNAWTENGAIPLALETLSIPVWIGTGLLDELAPPERVVPTSRRIADRTLVRLGITHFDPRDYTHLDLLTDEVPIRAAVRAARP